MLRTLLFCLFAVVPFAHSQEPVKLNLVVEKTSVQPGQPFYIALQLELEEGWHAYWKNPGDAGMAPQVEWQLPEGFEAGAIQWPVPTRYEKDEIVTYGYDGNTSLLVEITPPKDLMTNKPVELSANLRWLVCSDEDCLPGESEASIMIPTSVAPSRSKTSFAALHEELPKHHSATAERDGEEIGLMLHGVTMTEGTKAYFYPEEPGMIDERQEIALQQTDEGTKLILRDISSAQALKGIVSLVGPNQNTHYDVQTPISSKEEGIMMVLLLAFAGGLLLNLMPCVLPVISFKVMSFVNMAGEKRSRTLKHGIFFTFGVLLSFWVLAGMLLGLQSYGRAVGWGFQLQEPIFVAGLAAFLFMFGLSLFGVFEVGTSFASMAGQAQVKSGKSEKLFSSFLSGILATAVATPCTGPFLGTAVGYAVTQPPLIAMSVFTMLGLGVAFPYLFLGAFPSLLRFLPKPGNWMVTFKELMGFVMIATVMWLIWVFGAQTNTLAVSILLAAFFFISIGCWILGKWGTPVKKKTVRIFSYLICGLMFATGGYMIFQASSLSSLPSDEIAMADGQISKNSWEPYNPQRIAELQEQGIPVFVDFTARWCLICQANHMVLSGSDVSAKFEELGVVKMMADWTKYDAAITEALSKFGRNGVPLYLYYGPNAKGKPQILPQVLTPGIVLGAINDSN